MRDNNNNDNTNNGLITKIWGPSMWNSLHAITFGYPVEPSNEQKLNYKNYFMMLGNVLPCKYCKDSYNKFISKGSSKLTDETLTNRDALTFWGYKLHQKVNEKLNIDYCVSYEEIKNRYESYRANCSSNINKNEKPKGCTIPITNTSYRIASKSKDAPFIPPNLVKCFINYAKKRNIDKHHFHLYNKYKNNIDVLINNKQCDEWHKRNEECNEIIQNMRINNIKSLDSDKNFLDLPSIDELKLILRFSSNIPKKTLYGIANNHFGKKIYKLSNNK
jgi:hypothetical protein